MRSKGAGKKAASERNGQKQTIPLAGFPLDFLTKNWYSWFCILFALAFCSRARRNSELCIRAHGASSSKCLFKCERWCETCETDLVHGSEMKRHFFVGFRFVERTYDIVARQEIGRFLWFWNCWCGNRINIKCNDEGLKLKTPNDWNLK